jgi:dTMP kinase
MKRGRFIALEGGEGAGKSTQARLLAAALTARGIEVVLTREPGGTALAERIRELLLSESEPLGLRAEALLFAAARSDHVERLIGPALQSGKWVVCDRFLDSSRAYQGGGGGLPDADILALHQFGSQGLLPDLTLLIAVDPQVAASRTAARDAGISDRIGGRDAAYHARVGQAFDAFANAQPDRFCRIDGNGLPEMAHRAIMTAILPWVEGR